MKFRKKPVVIEATQWFKHGDHPAVKPRYTHGPNDEHWRPSVPTEKGWIRTLEGDHTVAHGDWIITGVKGEHYPCKPDIFDMTYEPVEETPCTHEWIDDTQTKPQWHCAKCGEEYKKDQP